MKTISLSATTPAAAMISWAIAAAAAWLAVAGQSWAQTLLIAAVGSLFFFHPPSGVVPRSVLILFGLVLLLSFTAFLPVSWIGSAVHQPFLDHGIVLPSTLSPQPWLTLEDVSLLFVTLLWAWSCFEFKLSNSQREFLLSSYLCALALVAVVTIVHETPFASSLPGFLQDLGQFPNRNQTGDLLVMGGVFCFARGVYELSKKSLSGGFWILLTGLFMAATTRNGSRAAEGLFAAGLILSFCLLPRARRRHWLAPIMVFAVLVAGLFIFVEEGAELQSRFNLMFAGQQEGRLDIYRDAISMILRDPWCGIGFGNFEGVFNVQRVASIHHEARCLHPESDWLWLATEMGVPGVILFALLVAVPFRIYLGNTPFFSMTRISIAVAILFIVHSLVDVGGHRIGTVWSCIYLVSLGAFRPASSNCARVPVLALRIVGLFLLLIAALRLQSVNVQPLMPTEASVEKVKEALTANVSPLDQKQLVDRALGWAPLDYELYFQRALACMQIPEQADKADDDFNRALFLEQNTLEFPEAIGEICRHSDFPEALVAWQTLLERAGPRREELFGQLCSSFSGDEKSRLELTTLTEGDPNLQTLSLIYERPPEFDWLLENLLTSDPSLKGVTPDLLRRLFDHWVEVGNAAQFLDVWPQHPEWQTPGWRAYALALAQAGRYKEAVATAFQFLPEPQTPTFRDTTNLEDAKQQYQDNPADPFNGIRLYFAQVAAGDNDGAAATLAQISKLPKQPDYIAYLLAKSLSSTGQDQQAWDALEPLAEAPQPD